MEHYHFVDVLSMTSGSRSRGAESISSLALKLDEDTEGPTYPMLVAADPFPIAYSPKVH